MINLESKNGLIVDIFREWERKVLDKFEYKVRAEEIKNLIANEEYAQAAEIADTIDWRRVKSVMMLCTISDLYKINRRFEDARDMLLLAYERRPGGRNICYSLCELSIKTGEFVQAMEYYKEFVQVAPRDPGRYILQYKLYEDQDVSLEERIEVLEELKKHDYREKWAYELAYLYHRVGLGTRCVEECDEMILWFGDGDYVIKAMELKMLHQPLSPEQQEKYDHRFDKQEEVLAESEVYDEQVMDTDLGQTREFGVEPADSGVSGDTQIYQPIREMDLERVDYAEDFYSQDGAVQTEVFLEEEPEELDIQVKTMDVGQYNTMNLQAELAQGLREILGEENKEQAVIEDEGIDNPITRSIMEPMLSSDTESLDYPEIDEVSEDDLEPEPEQIETSEIFFGETGEIALEQVCLGDVTIGDIVETLPEHYGEEEPIVEEVVAQPVSSVNSRMTVIEPPKELAHVLSQEADGQISLVVPESEKVEKQITGQMNIEDILAEWERWKQETKEKHQEELRQHVLQQTGNMFTEFEAAVRDGLLEQLEKSVDEPEDNLTSEDEVEELAEIEETAGTVEAEEIAAAEDAVETEATMVVDESVETEEDAVEEIAEVEDVAETEATIAVEQSEEALEETIEENAETEEIAEAEEITEAEEIAELEEYSEEMSVEEVLEMPEEAQSEEAVQADETMKASGRAMTKEEQDFYSAFIQHRSTEEQIVKAIDNISLAAYTGNIIITGEAGIDILDLAKNMIREVQATDNNFSGKVAKISGQGLGHKNIAETLVQLQNGALIIQDAGDMDEQTVQNLYKSLQNEALGIIVLLLDDVKVMNRFLKTYEYLLDVFTARVDVKALSNDMLVAYGKQYAREQEYAIDELGLLALHTCIENRQTLDHAVTTAEVQELVDAAIRRANRKTPGHFFSVLLSKRYDEEDMIIITEKDFAQK